MPVALVFVASALMTAWLWWPMYIDYRLHKIGWRTSDIASMKGSISCGSIGKRDKRRSIAWPLPYKPEWTTLDIGCTVTMRDAADLARAKHLQKLIFECSFEAGALAQIARLPRLTHVEFYTCRPSVLRELRASESLVSITIHGEFDTAIVKAISEITTLEEVVLWGLVTAEDIEPLACLPRLRRLHVEFLKPSPGLVSVFQQMRHLRELDLGENPGYDLMGRPLRGACPELRIMTSQDRKLGHPAEGEPNPQ